MASGFTTFSCPVSEKFRKANQLSVERDPRLFLMNPFFFFLQLAAIVTLAVVLITILTAPLLPSCVLCLPNILCTRTYCISLHFHEDIIDRDNYIQIILCEADTKHFISVEESIKCNNQNSWIVTCFYSFSNVWLN